MSDAGLERHWPGTSQEFLAWPGDGRAKRYQLVDGVVRAMSPASAFHGLIQATFGSMILAHLRGSGSACKVLIEPAVKPRLRAASNIRVPDLAVTCMPIAAGQIVIEDPIFLVEILWPSNRAKTWTNAWAYTTIPSLREIAIVHSDKIEVQILRCSAERIWPDNAETLGPGDTLRLDSIGLACPIEDLYADVPLS